MESMKRTLAAALMLAASLVSADDLLEPIIETSVTYFELQEVEIVGDRAYVCNVAGLAILDISNPAVPQHLGSYPPPPSNFDRFYRATVAGNWVFGGGRNELLKIIDISDETNPTLGIVHGEPGMSYEGCAISGDILYAARHADGLETLDVANPAAPVVLHELDALESCWDVAVRGGYAFVADGADGMAVLDLSDPAAPVHLYSLPTSSAAMDIELSGDLALLACGSAGVEIFDIADPLAAAWVGNYDSSGLAIHLDTVGDLLFIADWDDVEVADISVPESPSPAGWERTPVRAMGLAAVGDLVYVADWARLMVYDYGPTGSGDIHVPLRGFEFGDVPVGETADTTFTVFNSGGATLQVTDVRTFNPNFVVQPPTSFAIPAGDSHLVGLSFTHAAPGFDGTFLRIDSDDPDESQLSFPVAGDDNPDYLNTGEAAPEFTLLDMAGASHTLSDYLGQVVVLSFFANW
jgi:hypothetical protein